MESLYQLFLLSIAFFPNADEMEEERKGQSKKNDEIKSQYK